MEVFWCVGKRVEEGMHSERRLDVWEQLYFVSPAGTGGGGGGGVEEWEWLGRVGGRWCAAG